MAKKKTTKKKVSKKVTKKVTKKVKKKTTKKKVMTKPFVSDITEFEEVADDMVLPESEVSTGVSLSDLDEDVTPLEDIEEYF